MNQIEVLQAGLFLIQAVILLRQWVAESKVERWVNFAVSCALCAMILGLGFFA